MLHPYTHTGPQCWSIRHSSSVMGKRNSVSPVIDIRWYDSEYCSTTEHQSTAVHVAIKKQLSTSGSFCDAPRSGRPSRVTRERDERSLKLAVQRNPYANLPVLVQGLEAADTTASAIIISRWLSKELGLESHRPAKKSRLTPAMRPTFARKYVHWTGEQWDTCYVDRWVFPQTA